MIYSEIGHNFIIMCVLIQNTDTEIQFNLLSRKIYYEEWNVKTWMYIFFKVNNCFYGSHSEESGVTLKMLNYNLLNGKVTCFADFTHFFLECVFLVVV